MIKKLSLIPLHLSYYLSYISCFLLQQIEKTMAVVKDCIMVKMDVTLPETKSFQLPEPQTPGTITMATMGLLVTCLVFLGKVKPGCAESRACRGTEGETSSMFANV